MTPTANGNFTGAGLFELGLEMGGVEVLQSYEIDEDCCATLRANMATRYGPSCRKIVQCDLRAQLALDGPEADIEVATYPCTKYSTIADIHGCRTGDELYLHFFRRMALRRPKAYVLENVPGMKKFKVVMEAMTKLPGYYVTVFCPVSSQTWLPQKRDRLIIIGTQREFAWRPAAPVGPPVRLKDILEENPRVEIPDYVYKRLDGKYRDLPIISDPAKGDIAPTCVAHYAKDLSTRLVVDKRFPRGVRPYSVREYARLQGVPDSYQFIGGDRAAYKMIGNGVSIPVGIWAGQELKRYFNN